MHASFKDDELRITLNKGERDDLRHVRNLTRELARYTPDASAVADGLTTILSRIGEDGEYATKPVEQGSTEVVSGKEVVDAGAAEESERIGSTATRKGGSR